MNVEKLKRLQSQVRIGGKGTPRRKKKVMHQSASTDDKRLQSALKKLSVSTIPGIEEVNIIKDDLTIIHFNNPKAQASLSANTFAVTGHAESKKIVEMLPEILPQLSQETVLQLRAFASQMSKQQKSALNLGDNSAYSSSGGATEDEDVPMLVGDFDEIAKIEAVSEPSVAKQTEALNLPETIAEKPTDSSNDKSSIDIKELKKSNDSIQENEGKKPQNRKNQTYQKQVVDDSVGPTKLQKIEKLNAEMKIPYQKGKQSKKEETDSNIDVSTEVLPKVTPPSSPATTKCVEGKQKSYEIKTDSKKIVNKSNANNAKKAEKIEKKEKQGEKADKGNVSKIYDKISKIDNPVKDGMDGMEDTIIADKHTESPKIDQVVSESFEVKNKIGTPITREKINPTVLSDTQEKTYKVGSPPRSEKAIPTNPTDTLEKTDLKGPSAVPEKATALAATPEKMSHTSIPASRENPITPVPPEMTAPPVTQEKSTFTVAPPATKTSNQIVLPIPATNKLSKSDEMIKAPLASSPTQLEIPSEMPVKVISQTENKPRDSEPPRKPDVKVPAQPPAIGAKASSPSKQQQQKISPPRQQQAPPKQIVSKSEGTAKRNIATKPQGAKSPHTLNSKVNNTQQPQSQVSPKTAALPLSNIPYPGPTPQKPSNPTTKLVQKSSAPKTSSQPQTKPSVSSKAIPSMKAKDTSNLKPSTPTKHTSTADTQNLDNSATTPATDKVLPQPI